MSELKHTAIARSYATALFNAGQKQGILQRLREEANTLSGMLEDKDGNAARLLVFLSDPQQATENKIELLNRVIKPRFSPVMFNLLKGVVQRDRTTYLPAIMEVFQLKIEEAEGVFHATVESAKELSFQEKLQLKKALESYTDAKLNIEYSIKPELIGGLVFRFKDVLIDGSLSRGLEDFGRRLKAVQVIS